jgi:hypothetical protein
MSTSTTGTDFEVPDWAKAALLLLLGVVIGGIADFALSQAGYASLGALTWAVAYSSVIIAVWAVWLRDLEFEPGG